MNIYSFKNNFIQNKYTNWYFTIIEKCVNEKRVKTKEQYFELHHILPNSVFPETKSEKWNLVYLTPKEHFICHWLLTKMISGKEKYKMFKALHKMSQKCSGERIISSFEYEIARKYNSISMKENNPMNREEVKNKVSQSRKGKSPTKETRLKMSENSAKYWKDKTSPYKGSKFYNNGIEHKMFLPETVPVGWILGRINEPWNKGKTNITKDI